jgi:hypothetical protein
MVAVDGVTPETETPLGTAHVEAARVAKAAALDQELDKVFEQTL